MPNACTTCHKPAWRADLRRTPHGRLCRACRETLRFLPKYRLRAELRFEDDPEAQRFVADHPDGATLEEIAQCLGVSRERVRQIEAEAMTKLRERLPADGAIMREDEGCPLMWEVACVGA